MRLSLGSFHSVKCLYLTPCQNYHKFFFFFLGTHCVPHYLASFVVRNTKIPLKQELVYMGGGFAKKLVCHFYTPILVVWSSLGQF